MTTEQNETPEEFPMVVWLRGDEPHFPIFSLSADQVMETLGIRRSRLNQISGKELRVGRARINNYIRPIYRPSDVEDYLQWTRPTASHQKSSVVLDQASKKLVDQSEALIKEFSSQVSIITPQLQQSIKDSRERLLKTLDPLFKNLRQSFIDQSEKTSKSETTFKAFAKSLFTIKEKLTPLHELLTHLSWMKVGLTTLLDQMSYQKNLVQSLKDQVRELTLKVQDLEAQQKEELAPKPRTRSKNRRPFPKVSEMEAPLFFRKTIKKRTRGFH